jgi:large subunit ribosomal protein L21
MEGPKRPALSANPLFKRIDRSAQGLIRASNWPPRDSPSAAFIYLEDRARALLSVKDKTMFAVIQTGGKQYKVAKDDIIIIEKLDGEAGGKVTFDNVLMHGAAGDVKVGAPLVKGASVTGEVLEQRKGDKVIVFKKKRRQNYRRKQGHRQLETVVRITGIKG